MSTMPTYSKFAQRFLGNSSSDKLEVHDIQRETTRCQVDEILRAGHAVRFIPDSIEEAHRNGFDNCAFCIGGSTR